jgi:ABC-2 type transport system permease protein
MNPTIRKELRARMRERRGWILPSLYLLTLAAVMSMAYYFAAVEGNSSQRTIQGAEVGIIIFIVLAFSQLALLLLLSPVFSAASITLEREQRTLPSLITSLLTPFQIWFGKFVASLLFVTLLLVISLPVLALVFALGGIGPREVIMGFVTTLITLASLSSMAIYFSSLFKRSVHSTAVSYAAIIALTVVTFVIYILVQSAWEAAHRGGDYLPPDYLNWPLYLNPFAFLAASFSPIRDLYPHWLICLAVFALIGLACAALAIRNIARSGDMV